MMRLPEGQSAEPPPEEDRKPAPAILSEDDKSLIKKVMDEKKSIQGNRWMFEKQWLVNIAFLYGKHYFSIEKTAKPGLEERIAWELKNLDRAKKTRRTVNYILPLYRSLLARMLQLKQSVIVNPSTRTDRDKSAARVGQEVLEDFWETVNRTNPILCQKYAGMMLVLARLFSYMLIMGKGYLLPNFNPGSKAKIVFENLDGKPIMDAPVGCVDVEVEHDFNLFIDPMGRYIIRKQIFGTDYIQELYNVEVESEDIGLSDVERQLQTLLEAGQDEKYKDSAEVFTRWELPSRKHPGGRLYVCTKNRILQQPVDLPNEYKGRLPVFEFRYLDIMLAQPQGAIEQLIPSQEEYNHTVSRLHEYKKWMNGKVLVPDKCKLHAKYDDQVGQMIKYDATGGKPTFDVPPGAPSFIMREIERIRRDMEDIASVHDASQGRAQSGVKSGQAIENLSELDNTQLSPQLIHIEQQLGFFADVVLDIVEAKYKYPRLLSIAGKDLASDVRTFKGKDVAGNRRIRISLGSSLPVSREARQQVIMTLADKGYITKEKALELLEFGDLDGVYRSIDEDAEKTEIQEMLNGIEIMPQAWENHARRLKVLTDYMMGDEFTQLMRNQDPQAQALVERIRQHRAAHQDLLSREMQAIPGAPGSAGPKPPAAPAPAAAAPAA